MPASPAHRAPDRRPFARPRTQAVAAALALCAAWQPVPAAGQSGDESFGEVISVHVVNVDVRVTDRQGQPVHGLDVGDFTLREDGNRQDITNFREVLPSGALADEADDGGA
ncbi:MAG: hypothetical protein AAFX50_11735, partial [Acidobacteriota bacterium]